MLLPEWAPQDFVLLTWPHPNTNFKNLLALDACYGDLCYWILKEARIKILCFDEAHQKHVESVLSKKGILIEKIEFYAIKTNDIWIRDYGVLSRFKNQRLRALKFEFNAWGRKYPFEDDNNAMIILNDRHGLPHADFLKIPFVLEGGSIETDGQNSLLTTEVCLLSDTRNAGVTKSLIEKLCEESFGVDRFFWLKHGELKGDDTDSHVDMLARFCSDEVIAYVTCENKHDFHFEPLVKMQKELSQFRDVRNQAYHLVPLPLPSPKTNSLGERLPASYANFLICNDQVLVPVYHDKADNIALKRLETCFPGKSIIPILALEWIEQFGSIHCATMQIPRSPTVNRKIV